MGAIEEADSQIVEHMIDSVQRGEHVSVSPYDNLGLIRERVRRRVRLMASLVEQCNEIEARLQGSPSGSEGT